TPTNLVAIPGDNQISLTWPQVGGNATYNVFRRTASGTATQINSALVTGGGFVDTNATNGVQFFYTVKATNNLGSSASSNEATATAGGQVTGTPLFQVNTSGNAIPPFDPDTNFATGGHSSGTGDTISTVGVIDPALPQVYQSERSGGTIEYKFPVS